MEDFLWSFLFKARLYNWKDTSTECETFGSYCHSEDLYKLFYFAWQSLEVIEWLSEKKCIKWNKSEIKARNKVVMKNSFSRAAPPLIYALMVYISIYILIYEFDIQTAPFIY